MSLKYCFCLDTLFCLTATFLFPLLLISRALSILSMSKASWVPGWMLPKYQWFSKYGPWIRSISLTWQAVEPHQTYWVRNSGSGVSTLNLTAPPGDLDVCSRLRTTLPYSIALSDYWEGHCIILVLQMELGFQNEKETDQYYPDSKWGLAPGHYPTSNSPVPWPSGSSWEAQPSSGA